MSPSAKELVLEISALKFVGIECNKCHTEIIFDLNNTAKAIPFECPTCRNGEYDIHFSTALDSLRTSYQVLSKSENQHVRIRIRRQLPAEF